MWRKTYRDENRVWRAPDGGENDVGADVKGVFREDHQAQAMRVVLSDGDGVFHVVSGGCSELSTAEELVFAEGVDEVVEEVDGWSVDGREEIVLWVKPLELKDLDGINEGEGEDKDESENTFQIDPTKLAPENCIFLHAHTHTHTHPDVYAHKEKKKKKGRW